MPTQIERRLGYRAGESAGVRRVSESSITSATCACMDGGATPPCSGSDFGHRTDDVKSLLSQRYFASFGLAGLMDSISYDSVLEL